MLQEIKKNKSKRYQGTLLLDNHVRLKTYGG